MKRKKTPDAVIDFDSIFINLRQNQIQNYSSIFISSHIILFISIYLNNEVSTWKKKNFWNDIDSDLFGNRSKEKEFFCLFSKQHSIIPKTFDDKIVVEKSHMKCYESFFFW